MAALKRAEIEQNTIETIFVTHFHGDHFGGIPYFVLDAQFLAKRTTPLTIVGPEGLETWYGRVMETTFPGSAAARRSFEIELIGVEPDHAMGVNGVEVLAARVRHGPPGFPCLAYRLTVDGKTIAYTGDTEWVDELIAIGGGADLLIAEAYTRERKTPLHLDLATLEAKLPQITPKRLILTHMGDDMLARARSLSHETAGDGKRVVI